MQADNNDDNNDKDDHDGNSDNGKKRAGFVVLQGVPKTQHVETTGNAADAGLVDESIVSRVYRRRGGQAGL